MHVATIVENTRTGRYHPFLWRLSPQPFSDATDNVHRYKSSAHHTAGFATFAEAEQFVETTKPHGTRYLPSYNTADFWGEREVPARISWFEVA